MPLGQSFRLNLIPSPRVDQGDGLQALSDISCVGNPIMGAQDVIVEDDCLHADVWKDVLEAANFLIYKYGRTNIKIIYISLITMAKAGVTKKVTKRVAKRSTGSKKIGKRVAKKAGVKRVAKKAAPATAPAAAGSAQATPQKAAAKRSTKKAAKRPAKKAAAPKRR
ncbi:UNKNOWN [Stylonychia lemnae]|uniref:Uncharacterized protein n=1 Tax=Stylonychia lemnae TaxID=5949 RepID=A0A078APV9_STYLE|nr:UNKNOWN [Stylonychia lemnae]|eukprot:CDW84011.1 UNKNOWN [Stylonychia lemnae]